eukprot:7391605-Prymnesium_polylepis.5
MQQPSRWWLSSRMPTTASRVLCGFLARWDKDHVRLSRRRQYKAVAGVCARHSCVDVCLLPDGGTAMRSG